MSGHSKWAQIKRQKGVTDKKRGQLFSKLLKAISIAAKPGSETSVASQEVKVQRVPLPGSQSVPQSGTSRSSTSWKTELNPPALSGRGSPSSAGRQYNPRLRSAIEKAKKNNVPQENIDRAVNKAAEEKNLEELIIEAYGPEGVALIIEGVTDNTNRSISEIKHILSENNAKIANSGSVLWAFSLEEGSTSGGEKMWQPKFPQEISEDSQRKITELIDALEEHDDVQSVITNIAD